MPDERPEVSQEGWKRLGRGLAGNIGVRVRGWCGERWGIGMGGCWGEEGRWIRLVGDFGGKAGDEGILVAGGQGCGWCREGFLSRSGWWFEEDHEND